MTNLGINNMEKLIILLFILAGLIGCTNVQPVDTIIYKTTPLQLPSAPILPTWNSIDMECLSVDIKQKMVERDKLRKEYIEKLVLIIRSTQ